MSLTQLAPPYPVFTDKDGDPLDNGYLYFGVANDNPETNPITVYYDRGFTQPVAQPVRTSNGYVMRNGSPALIYANSASFSVTVRNKRNELVIYSPTGFGVTPGIPFAVFDNAAKDVADLLADTQFTYNTGISGTVQVSPGDILRTLAEGFSYEVAASNANDQDIITAGGVKLYYKTASNALGNQGAQYNLIGAAFRRDTQIDPSWFTISDSTHIPINVSGVAPTSVNLRISYPGNKIGSMIIAPDETMATDGVFVGASVSSNFCDVSLGAPCSIVIDFDNANAISFSSRYFDASRFSVSVASSGLVTIGHPGLQLMQTPIVQHTRNSSLEENFSVHSINNPTQFSTTLWLLREAEGLITYNGTNWQISSSPWSTSDLTFSYDPVTGVLSVTHPSVNGSPSVSITRFDNGTNGILSLSNLVSTGFDVRFADLAGSIPSLASIGGFYFSRGKTLRASSLAGRLHVDFGVVQADMSQVDFDGVNGNFWAFGAMQR